VGFLLLNLSFSVECFVVHCLSFYRVSFKHYLYDTWLSISYLQTFLNTTKNGKFREKNNLHTKQIMTMRCATKIQATNVRTHCRAETIRTPTNQCKAHVVQTQSSFKFLPQKPMFSFSVSLIFLKILIFITPRYSWNTTTVVVKHQSINHYFSSPVLETIINFHIGRISVHR
jgi:hypothetical protein